MKSNIPKKNKKEIEKITKFSPYIEYLAISEIM